MRLLFQAGVSEILWADPYTDRDDVLRAPDLGIVEDRISGMTRWRFFRNGPAR